MGFGSPSVQPDPALAAEQKKLATQQAAEEKKREQIRIAMLRARQQGVPLGGGKPSGGGQQTTSDTLG